MKILNELDELVQYAVITPDTAQAIKEYYEAKKEPSPLSMLAVFGMIGALLTGLGLILIFAHNWDIFPKAVKVLLALLPLFIAQAAVGYAVIKNKSSLFKTTAGVLVFFTVGASISLVAQIYNIPGSISSLLMLWVLLCLPLVYLMRSTMLFIVLLIASTLYGTSSGYFTNNYPYMYLVFLAALLPFYINQLKSMPAGNAVAINNFLLPLSIIICLGAFIKETYVFNIVIYIALLSVFYNTGRLKIFAGYNTRNGYTLTAVAGILGLLLFLSFHLIWKEAFNTENPGLLSIIIAILFTGIAACIFTLNKKYKIHNGLFAVMAFIFPVIYITGFINYIFPVILVNVLVVSLGILAIKKGLDSYNFVKLNVGLLIIAVLVTCRFFDTDISFVVRGILFIAVGAGFFLANIRLAKKKNDISLKQ